MAESFKKKRIVLPKGRQRVFLNRILERVSLKKAADLCGVSQRTIRDWRREKFLMDANAVKVLCRKTHIPFPQKTKLLDQYWYTSKGAKRGWEVVYKRYGRVPVDEEYRKKKWFEWWEREGQFRTNLITTQRPIKAPRFSAEVAEFVGIMMGDGGISSNQIVITLHKHDDKEYSLFVKRLIEDLFSVPVSVYNRQYEQAVSLVVSRKALVVFCNERLGLKIGNKIKQNLDVPQWITKNAKFKRSCLRGLVDTDGSLFWERHYTPKKIYSYPRLNFTSVSPLLVRSVFDLLKECGFAPKFRREKSVQLEHKKEIARYFQIVGTHNPKHLKRYKKQGIIGITGGIG